MSDGSRKSLPAPLVAVAGWLVPGLGYWLIGHRARAATVCIAILLLFAAGILVAGVRSIDVPGYTDDGQPVMVVTKTDSRGVAAEHRSNQGAAWVATDSDASWVVWKHPIAEALNKPWYIGQIFAGPLTLACSKLSVELSKPTGGDPYGPPGAPKSHVRVAEIGTLYTAVAGMLNLLAIIDAAHRANRKEAVA